MKEKGNDADDDDVDDDVDDDDDDDYDNVMIRMLNAHTHTRIYIIYSMI